VPTRYGISPWIDRIPSKKRPSHPLFRGDIEAPLVIIGGGLSGVMTAYAAAAAGIKAVLLEADHLGHGGSGYATGICAGEGATSFVDQQAAAGRRVARAQFEQLRRAVLDLATATRRLELAARVEAKAAIRLVQPGASTGLLRKDVEARREAGLDASWIKSGAVVTAAGVDAETGARLAPWAVCDPYALVIGFAAAARARGAHIFERSPVTKIAFDRVRATVITASGRIVTPHVVHATGEPTRLVAGLKRHFRWESRGLALSEPLPIAVRRAVGSRDHVVYDLDVPPHAIRWTADHRVLVSGRDAKRPKPMYVGKLDVQRTGELMYELSRLYPDISGVMPAYGWSLSVAHSVDGGLMVGPHRNFPHQLFAFGTAHDPARTYLASRILLRHVQGTTTKDDEPFGFARTLHS
jgi:glycine/D-amino acid oxidase-like deaminating enzyme